MSYSVQFIFISRNMCQDNWPSLTWALVLVSCPGFEICATCLCLEKKLYVLCLAYDCLTRGDFNSLDPMGCGCNFYWCNIWIHGNHWYLKHFMWNCPPPPTPHPHPHPLGKTEDTMAGRSTLAQVMAWCRQAANHYLNQCWPDTSSICIYGTQFINHYCCRCPSTFQ